MLYDKNMGPMVMNCRELVSIAVKKERNQGALLSICFHCLANIQIKILGLMLLSNTAEV